MRKKTKRSIILYFGLVIFLFVAALVIFGDKSRVPTIDDYRVTKTECDPVGVVTAGPIGEYTWGWSND